MDALDIWLDLKIFLTLRNPAPTTMLYLEMGQKVRLSLTSNGLPDVNNVLLVKWLTSNLISIRQLCDQGMSVKFSKSACFMTDEKGEVIMSGIKSEGNYYLWIPLSKDQTEKNIWI